MALLPGKGERDRKTDKSKLRKADRTAAAS